MNCDYLLENTLKKSDAKLHRLFKDSVFSMQNILLKYKNIFPTYTDHTALHSLEVIDFCNHLIGTENIKRLNSDEIYILLMSCYLHDSGMGITMSDYEKFSGNIDFGDYFEKNPDAEIPQIIRDFHHEFSGEYIKKYGQFFDIPSKEHEFCIIQVSRGHRKTDLYDEKEYPSEYELPDGNKVCLPYLAALIRLADELDIAADRNLQFMYDLKLINNEYSRMEFKKHKAIKEIKFTEKNFIMVVDTDDQTVFNGVVELKSKLKSTLDECRNVVAKRTPFEITQQDIIIEKFGGE